ncbi:MAG TPA: hypothetical protein VGR89_04185 [Puia sp.]|nr:hypothetical protein [Puia sp.]
MTLFKSTLVAAAVPIALAACHGPGKAGAMLPDSTAPGRPSLIAQLKGIHRLLATGDKHMIAQLFSYPVPDSVGNIYAEDTAFRTELARNGGNMTREMFLRYFDSISPALQFDQFNRAFELLNVDSLARRDTLETEDDTTNEPCTYFYRIRVDGDTLVSITYGVSSVNPDYSASAEKEREASATTKGQKEGVQGAIRDSSAKAGAGMDAPARSRDSAARAAEDSTARDELYNEGACEHDIYWVYRFDGRKLHLIKHDAAD